MKLQAVVVGVLLPVLFSTTNSPSHTHWMVGTSAIGRRSRWCIRESQVVSCLDPHGSLPVPSMNHTEIKLLSDLLQLTDQPMVAATITMECSEPTIYKPHLVKQLLCPMYLMMVLTLFSAVIGAMLSTTAIIVTLAYCICSSLTRKLYPSYKSYRGTKMKMNPILKQNGQGTLYNNLVPL